MHAVAQAVEGEDNTNEPKKDIDLEGEGEAEKGVDEANAALNSVTVESELVVEAKTTPTVVPKESNGNNPLDATPTTSNEDDKGEEKKIEAESDKAAPKSPSKIGAIKNMKNRRKAAAKKKKRKGSTN